MKICIGSNADCDAIVKDYIIVNTNNNAKKLVKILGVNEKYISPCG